MSAATASCLIIRPPCVLKHCCIMCAVVSCTPHPALHFTSSTEFPVLPVLSVHERMRWARLPAILTSCVLPLSLLILNHSWLTPLSPCLLITGCLL
ncbi:hypothetical protein PUN28_017937 [Cardiocondyla obscurior]|uniref:Uncharacterized protein n=1 Tax=Cardiocondyla obscurior TaxID=286306 RepID=A0AAW2ELN4_9HYME